MILSIDSSGLVATVALCDEGRIIAEYSTDYQKTHSQTLLPMIDSVMQMTDTAPEALDAIVISAGPGSFTGLRIGAATAKGLGLALDIPLIGVPTLYGLAYNLYGFDAIAVPMMDARREQVYTGVYEMTVGDSDAKVWRDTDTIGVKALLAWIEEQAEEFAEIGKKLYFLGDGVPVYKDTVTEAMDALATKMAASGKELTYCFAPAHLSRQRASAFALCGAAHAESEWKTDADAFAPNYYRLSQAERERAEKEQAQKG